MCDLQQKRGFSDSRLAADQHRRSWDDAAAENAIEFPDAGASTGKFGFVDVVEFQCFASVRDIAALSVAGSACGGAGISRRRFVFLKAVPRSAIRTFSDPLGMDAATVVAEELGAGLGHWLHFSGSKPLWHVTAENYLS